MAESLAKSEFKFLVDKSVLPSIDLCVVWENSLLLGRRKFGPLKGEWFTPGGCIRKGESWRSTIERVARDELSLNICSQDFELMGLWDHFYEESAFEDVCSTQYINMPHFRRFSRKPEVASDHQHDELVWFPLEELIGDSNFHEDIKSYAVWIKKRSDFSAENR